MIRAYLIFNAFLHLAFGNPTDNLVTLEDEFSDWLLSENPEYASRLGDHRFDDKLDDLSIETFDRWRDNVSVFKNRLKEIPRSELSEKHRINYDILQDYLQTYLDGYQWRMYNALNPIDIMNRLSDGADNLVTSFVKSTKKGFADFVKRIQMLSTQVQQMKSRMIKAVEVGHVPHIVSVESVPDMIDGLITTDVEDSIFYSPFNTDLNNISSLNQQDRASIQLSAKSAIQNYVESLKDLKNYVSSVYLTNTRQGYGLSTLDNGSEYYKACLQFIVSLPLTPEEVHQTGLKEVDRISRKIKKLFQNLGITGNIKEGYDALKEKPQYFLNSSDEMIALYNNIIHEEIHQKLPTLFKDLPDLPVEVKAMPYDGPFGMYFGPLPDGSRPGVFSLNTHHPDQSPTFNFMPTALHETNPGHHLQISIMKLAEIPKYRKNKLSVKLFQNPTMFPLWTGYTEGWALYAEYLGEEMGLYETDTELLGRYSQEMLRACRLVVDTGIHYFNWTRQQAIQYMSNYTASGQSEIEFEVNRYITIPGQACAYKIGELKIKELRKQSEDELGKHFDIKEFHSVVLRNGALSLSTLEAIVKDWVEHVKVANGLSNNGVTLSCVNLYFLSCIMFFLTEYWDVL